MKNKKNLLVLLLIAIVGVVGLTIAYFSSSSSFENTFEASEYGSETIEQFTSPDDWVPGTTTPKTLKVKNTGEVDEAVRVTYSEKWVSKNGDELPLKQNGNDVAIINWNNLRDWKKEGNTFYYKYKLAPNEETSELLESVTYNIEVLSDATCTTETEDNTTVTTCSSSGDGYDGATYTLTFVIDTVQFNKYREAWQLEDNSNVTIASESKPDPITLAQFVANNTNPGTVTSYNDDNADKSKMFEFSHEVNNETINEVRYIGNSANNYVEFNCDRDGTNCEIWRIIGVFDVEREIDDPDQVGQKITITEQRMKLVRGEILKNDYWNSEINANDGYNDWTADNATLKLFLNGDYYNGVAEHGLKASARELIDDAKYYLGARESVLNTTEELYALERGSILCGSCGEDTTKLRWQGTVGLMYASDVYMVYGKDVNVTCYSNPNVCRNDNAATGWVYNSNALSDSIVETFVLMPTSNFPDRVFTADTNGDFYGNRLANARFGVRPVVYLVSDIKIADGDGSSGNPFVLSK